MGKGSGITKEMKASSELQDVIKEKKVSRGQMMKLFWKYVKKHGLQSEEDGRIVKCNSKLEALFGKAVKDKRKIEVRGKTIKIPAGHIFMTEISKQLSKHLS